MYSFGMKYYFSYNKVSNFINYVKIGLFPLFPLRGIV